MRHLAAIIAALLSVTTGGPLRCPCRLAALTCSPVEAAPERADEACRSHKCGCKPLAEQDVRRPGPPTSPRPEPCEHGPGVDLLALSAADPQTDEADSTPHIVPGVLHTASNVATVHVLLPGTCGRSTSPTSHFRYAHAFRC